MELRDAMQADAEAVATVARASWHEAYDELVGAATVDSTVDRWYDPESLRKTIADATEVDSEASDEQTVFLVAERDGEVVGFTNAGPAPDSESGPDADAFLARLYVHPDCWGAGIGTGLAGRLARRLQDTGYERIWLEVFAENDPGREFYESLGFERVGSERETFGGTELTTLQLAMDVTALVAATAAD
jgi:ribosomal protein S18 acetylase RimI-like enzyme